MKKIALIAVIAATVAAPAFAQSARVGAVQFLNLSNDTVAEQITLNNVGSAANTSGSLGEAFRVLNRSADVPTDLTGTNGATAVSNTPAYGVEIFSRLRAADNE